MSRWFPPGPSAVRAPEARGWTYFAAGAVVGAALGWLAHGLRDGSAGRRDEATDPPESPSVSSGGPPPRGTGTWEAVLARLDEARAALARAEALDVEAVARRVGDEPGGDQVRVRELGPGIIELVGRAPDPSTGVRLAALAAAQPGVDSVVNRIWTAASDP